MKIGGHSGRWELYAENEEEKKCIYEMTTELGNGFGVLSFVGDSDEFGSAVIVSTRGGDY